MCICHIEKNENRTKLLFHRDSFINAETRSQLHLFSNDRYVGYSSTVGSWLAIDRLLKSVNFVINKPNTFGISKVSRGQLPFLLNHGDFLENQEKLRLCIGDFAPCWVGSMGLNQLEVYDIDQSLKAFKIDLAEPVVITPVGKDRLSHERTKNLIAKSDISFTDFCASEYLISAKDYGTTTSTEIQLFRHKIVITTIDHSQTIQTSDVFGYLNE